MPCRNSRCSATSLTPSTGHALNAVVTVVTRSGTNRFSGSGFYFGRDDRLNARNPFARDKPPFDERRFGGTFSGPVVRDRSHFFASYERDTVRNSRIIALPPGNVLAATENGVFPAESHDVLSTLRLDHRLNAKHALSLRYNNEHQRSLRSAAAVTSDTSQVDTFNRSHSLVVEEIWTPEQNVANALRVHLLAHTLGTVARNTMTAVSPARRQHRPGEPRLTGGAENEGRPVGYDLHPHRPP